ncbi:GNAT family N-acetyltransferase [Aliiroseovarius sp. KMU-50]|uniref:GNAT family N-acetyltransferase n=1 Tax=Aliiroseovarius salicola TaxID=3009082 RepID=A0ABT4VXL6_9RHOB|nr:GNAT family N-acetyltransferase [Aliiroseovarius sp. KMU-50]MDA5093008.1 GNAT family N-acetyltransferase [Aliiroseovarius sp. KMU-50]
MKSLEFASDLMVLRGQCEVETYSDRIVQRSPSQPNFWFGNRVLFRDPPRDATALVAQFQTDLPDAEHICLGWDIPNLPIHDVKQMFEAQGLKVEAADTLALSGDLNRPDLPRGLTTRAFERESDWHQSEAISRSQHFVDGLPEEGLDRFLSGQSAARQAQISKGFGQWFGAFDGDQLLGDMGIFFDDRVIRYQSVQTHEKYRRRGICSALLCHALDWAKAKAPQARPLIVAESNSDAGRLYLRAGFELFETTVSAYRPPSES